MATLARRADHRVTFAVLAIGVSSYSLLQSMSVPTLPLIQVELETDQATASWILTAFLISASVATPIMGRLGDIFGKQRMLVLSLALLALGSLVAAFATSIEMMLIARVIQGFGGGVLPLAFGIVRDEFPVDRIAGAISVISSLLAVGFGLGIVVAGPIVDGLGYEWLFWLPTLVATSAALAAWIVIPESPVRSAGRVRFTPAVLLGGWLVALLLGISQAPNWGWTSPAVLGLLGTALVLLVVWIVVECRIDVPLIDMRMMAHRGVWTSNLVALLIGVSMYASFGFLPQFYQTPADAGYGFGASITESGHMMLPSAIGTFLTGLASARIARWIGAKTVVILGGFLASVGLVLVATVHHDQSLMYVWSGMIGLGVGLVFACLANLVLAAVPPSQSGVATGMNANIRTIGGAIGAAVMTTIVTARALPSGYPDEAGYTVGFLVLAGSALLAGLAGFLIPAAGSRRARAALRSDREDVVEPALVD